MLEYGKSASEIFKNRIAGNYTLRVQYFGSIPNIPSVKESSILIKSNKVNSVEQTCANVSLRKESDNNIDFHEGVFKIYPNPNIGEFRIEFPTANDTYIVRIYDVLGNKIYENTSSDVYFSDINISKISTSAIYLICIQNTEHYYTEKI